MPVDRNVDDEEIAREQKEDLGTQGTNARFKDFDCPECNANNPQDERIGNDDEVICNYCGQEYRVRVNDDGKMKLKPL